ncbi:hypothetical protein ACTHPH_22185 [Paenibacillus pasadenensis]|uniref:hypothetical protein n=1 Tax=Paenibacillus TaxID=44249 RepID=UPI0003F953DB|nr:MULTISPECIES: hypothetical protein [Paenibacillus]QGG54348.1 hypothetical protein GE073_01130 [Paenibacillus sp. B01]
MSQWLDAKASQNASYGSSISIPLASGGSLQLVAQQTLDLSLGTAGGTVVEFSGTVTVQQPTAAADAVISFYVIRGLTPFAGTVVYTLDQDLLATEVGPRAISFTGSDSGAPNASSAPYSVFVTSSVAGILRVGPESFNFTGYSS